MQGHRRGLHTRSLALLAFAALVVIPGAGAMTMSNGNNGGLPKLNVLSNRADLISGGDALVQVVLPGRVDPSTVRVIVDGKLLYRLPVAHIEGIRHNPRARLQLLKQFGLES